MSGLGSKTKDPNATLDYSINWSAWLAGDTIAASTWTVPTGLTQAMPDPSFTDTATTIWLSGGTAGTRYSVTNRIVTAGGRTDERSFELMVEDR